MQYQVALVSLLVCWSVTAGAQDLRRATVWDLKLGQAHSAQPSPDQFGDFACGANGGPPRLKLGGWSEFARCPAEPSGLHEIYFEYDDEYEYVARARELPREVARWAGTTEAGFPVMTSALFDDDGVLRGIRVVTDARPDYRANLTEAEPKKRAQAYLFGGAMAARFGIEAERDCISLPAATGESAVGSLFVKLSCELSDPAHGMKITIVTHYFRKPGQSGTNPQLASQLTAGQFESSARLEVREARPQ
jgi:hypothetical protein